MKENEKNNDIFQAALAEHKKLEEAAIKIAMERLAKEELPERYNQVLKEEIDKLTNMKESVNESENGKEKEPVVEGKEKTDENKESINEMTEMDMTEMSMDQVEEAYDEAEVSDEFEVVGDEINLNDIEKELGEMEQLTNEMEHAHQEEAGHANEMNTHVGDSDPYDQIRKIYEMMGNVIKADDDKKMHEMHSQEFDTKMKEMYGEGYKESMGEEKCNELYEMYVSSKGSAEAQPETVTESVDEVVTENEEEVVTENAEEAVVENAEAITEEKDGDSEDHREEDEKVDEIHSHALSANKIVSGDQTPQPEYADIKKNKIRYALQKEEVDKKIEGFIAENKKSIKKLNEAKAELAKKDESINELRGYLEKYRGQLQEMAVFNTNLAYVNNILINEDFALTTEDKSGIINKFKDVSSIDESQELYNSIISEMKESSKTLIETVENKVNDSIGSGASQEIVEKVGEKTAYSTVNENLHIKKMKKLFEYVDNHGKNKL